MKTYTEHWADVIGASYEGLTNKERNTLTDIESKLITLHNGARKRVSHLNGQQQAYIIEYNQIEGYLDGLEDTIDIMKADGFIYKDFYNVAEALISLWDDIITDMFNEVMGA